MNLAFKLAQMDPSLPRLPGSLHVNRQLGQWLKFHADGHVSVYSGKVEIGQGIITALAQIAAEELDLTLARVRMVPACTATASSGASPRGPNTFGK